MTWVASMVAVAAVASVAWFPCRAAADDGAFGPSSVRVAAADVVTVTRLAGGESAPLEAALAMHADYLDEWSASRSGGTTAAERNLHALFMRLSGSRPAAGGGAPFRSAGRALAAERNGQSRAARDLLEAIIQLHADGDAVRAERARLCADAVVRRGLCFAAVGIPPRDPVAELQSDPAVVDRLVARGAAPASRSAGAAIERALAARAEAIAVSLGAFVDAGMPADPDWRSDELVAAEECVATAVADASASIGVHDPVASAWIDLSAVAHRLDFAPVTPHSSDVGARVRAQEALLGIILASDASCVTADLERASVTRARRLIALASDGSAPGRDELDAIAAGIRGDAAALASCTDRISALVPAPRPGSNDCVRPWANIDPGNPVPDMPCFWTLADPVLGLSASVDAAEVVAACSSGMASQDAIRRYSDARGEVIALLVAACGRIDPKAPTPDGEAAARARSRAFEELSGLAGRLPVLAGELFDSSPGDRHACRIAWLQRALPSLSVSIRRWGTSIDLIEASDARTRRLAVESALDGLASQLLAPPPGSSMAQRRLARESAVRACVVRCESIAAVASAAARTLGTQRAARAELSSLRSFADPDAVSVDD